MISVVIPTCNSEEGLARTLSSLVTAAAEGVVREVVVVDSGSTDGTRLVAEAAGCALVDRSGSWGEQIGAGVDTMRRSPWLLILPPHVDVDANWHREASVFMERIDRAGRTRTDAACFRLEFDSFGWQARVTERLVAWGGTLGGWYTAEQGLLLPRPVWDRVTSGNLPATYAALIGRIGRRNMHRLRASGVVLDVAGAPGRVDGVARALRYCLSGLRVPGIGLNR